MHAHGGICNIIALFFAFNKQKDRILLVKAKKCIYTEKAAKPDRFAAHAELSLACCRHTAHLRRGEHSLKAGRFSGE